MSSKPTEPTLRQALEHHQAGRLDQAEGLYRRILATRPDEPDALHLLGVIHHQRGQATQAVELISRALGRSPANPSYLSNLGLALAAAGREDDAARCYEQALTIAPGHAEAHYNLGLVRQSQLRLEEALACYRRAAELAPRHVQALLAMGDVLRLQGRLLEAEATYRRAREVEPGNMEVLDRLAGSLLEQRRLEEAEALYRAKLEAEPDDARTLTNLGSTLRRAGRSAEAGDLHRRAIALRPGFADAHRNLGLALREQGRIDDACEAFSQAMQIKRRPTSTPDGPRAYRTTRAKLAHDIEQLEYLTRRGLGAAHIEQALAEYRAALDTLPADLPPGQAVEIRADRFAGLASWYNRLLHLAAAPALPDGALNPDLDAAAIEADYREHAPGITFFDDLLRPEALASLRRFCLESTLWFDCEHPNGYVGAYMEDGFFCPLLLQIATELPRALPEIFADHPLLQLWAYKYDSRLAGIEMHADFAAVNVNFWITSDEANLSPDCGGLVVWDREAPPDWDIDRYNSSKAEDQAAIRDFLQAGDAHAITVPHRQNRVVVFNSDLFHQTDTIRFRQGYENRRINITMLYGKREQDR